MAKSELYPQNPILLVDDESQVLTSLGRILRSRGFSHIRFCSDSREVMPILTDQEMELILLDLTMPHLSGEELLKQIHEQYPYIPVIIVTGTDEIDTAVQCIKSGAVDYMVKAVEENRLISGVTQALRNRELKRDYFSLKQQFFKGSLSRPRMFSSIITNNREMKQIFLYLEAIAGSRESILITGETGTGKELIAEAIHKLSERAGEFVTVNIAGLDDNMFSDTLFGHKKGSFTTATTSRKGLIEQAEEGTLFLDEIGDLPAASQIKLLRLLETKEYYPIGSDVPKRAKARLVFATNKNVEAAMKAGEIRKDFYYRISTHAVHIPPLRERKDDIPLLIDYFVKQACEEFGKAVPEVPQSIYGGLRSYPFTGNVRELRSMIFQAVSTLQGDRLPEHAFPGITPQGPPTMRGNWDGTILFPEELPTIKEAAETLVEEALKRTHGNQSEAAKLLGITPQALSKRLRKGG